MLPASAFRSFEAYKPFRNGIVCACAAFWLRDREGGHTRGGIGSAAWGAPLAVCAAAISAMLAVRFGIFVAGGSDAYGYVSQAALWAVGRSDRSRTAGADWQGCRASSRPRLATGRRSSPAPACSTYAPGYPMLMALAMKVGGDSAAYMVVPICAGPHRAC